MANNFNLISSNSSLLSQVNGIRKNNSFPLLKLAENSTKQLDSNSSKILSESDSFQCKHTLNRSKSSIDIKLNHSEKYEYSRPKSGINFLKKSTKGNRDQLQVITPNMSSSNLISADIYGNKHSNVIAKENWVKIRNSTKIVKRSHSESKLTISKTTQSNYIAGKQTSNSSTSERAECQIVQKCIIQKSGPCDDTKNISIRMLTGAFSKIQSNLQHLNKHFDSKMLSENRDLSNLSEYSDSITASSSSSSEEEEEILPRTVSEKKEQLTDVSTFGVLNKTCPQFYAKMDNNVLRIYGNGTLAYPELLWDKCTTTNATCVLFENIEFDDITEIFPCLRIRFPNLERFIFSETNINKLGQLNVLSEIHYVSNMSYLVLIFIEKKIFT